MPQIFSPRTNTFARLSILAILLGVLIITGALAWWLHSSAFTKVGVAIQQPIPYSHALHVGALGLNCRYCHDTVDQSSFADLPPSETCMSCHSQIAVNSPNIAPIAQSYESGQPIQWVRVNQLPGFVYFNHEIHVNKGVGCETCHGRVDQMNQVAKAHTFYMSWCLECHENPQKYLRPVENVYDMGYVPSQDQATLGAQLVKDYNIRSTFELMNCSTCHR